MASKYKGGQASLFAFGGGTASKPAPEVKPEPPANPEPPVERAAALPAEEIVDRQIILIALSRRTGVPQIDRETGEMYTALNVHERFRWYRRKDDGDQAHNSLGETLDELDAPVQSWQRYTSAEPGLLSFNHLKRCRDRVRLHRVSFTWGVDKEGRPVERTGFVCCPACGWWYPFEGSEADLFRPLDEIEIEIFSDIG